MVHLKSYTLFFKPFQTYYTELLVNFAFLKFKDLKRCHNEILIFFKLNKI